MLTTSRIRLAEPSDAEQVLAIYAPVVLRSATSFELEPPTAAQMQQRIKSTLEYAPWLVCERDGEVVGYAYAGKHRERPAYQWSIEVSVYVREGLRRSGVGRGLYASLFSALSRQGYYNAYAGITLPNAASVGLHESLGFRAVGVYRRAGYKLGAWHDVGWWQLDLQPHVAAPSPPKKFNELLQTAEWRKAISAGERLLR